MALAKQETQRLRYLETHQDEIRAELYPDHDGYPFDDGFYDDHPAQVANTFVQRFAEGKLEGVRAQEKQRL